MAIRLLDLTAPDLIFTDLDGYDRDAVLRFFAERIASVADLRPVSLHEGLLEREKLGSTALGRGVAVPHCRIGEIDRSLVAIGVAPGGIEFDAADGEPVKAFFVVVSPESDPKQNLQCLSAISHWIQEDDHLSRLLEMPTAPAILELLEETAAEDG